MKSHINLSRNKPNFPSSIGVDEKVYFAARGDGLSAEKLQNEKDFKSYLKMLWGFAQRYCVIVCAGGAACGPDYTRDISEAFMNIGFETDLRGRDFCGYVGMIDTGRIVFEMLETDRKKDINASCELDTKDVVYVRSACGCSIISDVGLIAVNENEYSPNGRGLNFVVYDKVTKNLIDAVCFDTEDGFKAVRRENYAKRFEAYLIGHPGVNVFGIDVMRFPRKFPTPSESELYRNEIGFYKLRDNPGEYGFVLEKYFDRADIPKLLEIPETYRGVNGVVRFSDKRSEHVNIADGHRVTARRSAGGGNVSVYICGICLTFGVGIDDSRTVPSYLQQMFDERLPEAGVTVHNYGYFLEKIDETEEILRLMETLPAKDGDIIIWNSYDYILKRAGVPIMSVELLAEKPHDKDYFFDTFHYTPDGCRAVAEKLFEELTGDRYGIGGVSSSEKPRISRERYGLDRTLSRELEEYKDILKNYYREMFVPTVGAVVMNCNPFTLGHRYLVEKALEQCDFLVIFVVEEDKSVFPFEDRLKLVDEGVKNLSNVTVIPSGKFIISSVTFSEYFNKSELQDRTVDASLDVSVFAREIAPCLHIVKRFAGSEPFDSVTKQYNDTMRQILPEYGIEFTEIPRAETDGEAISASRVRQMILDGNLEGTKRLVPLSTYNYLVGLFGNIK